MLSSNEGLCSQTHGEQVEATPEVKTSTMKGFLKLKVKSKLMLALLGVSLGSILVVGSLSLQRGRAILKESIFNQLTSIRTSKAHQFELFFENLRYQVEIFCNDKMFVAAMLEFEKAYEELEEAELPEDWQKSIDAYYTDEFFPRLKENTEGDPILDVYRPVVNASRYLQYHYLTNNPKPVGEKNQQLDARDGSNYSKVHRKYHPNFNEIIEKFGYYDLFLIDPETGNIVYSVYKETDYATSLFLGPYRRSNLAAVVNEVLDNPGKGAVQIVDFEAYRPSYEAPAAFLAGPIYDGPKMVGILAIQLPVEQINRVMTEGQDWKGSGLGETGETYLVGNDRLMRSVSRFFIETPEDYKKKLRSQGTSEETIQLMKNFDTTILLQEVNTMAAQRALSGKEGTQEVRDYRGVPVLSAYKPLDIEGLRWVILAEMDIAEAYQPLRDLQRSIFILTVVLILFVTWLANVAANVFVKPIKRLSEGAREVGEGHLDTEVKLDSDDEFGELAQTFNAMVQNLQTQRDAIAQKNSENESLLLNILPSAVAARLKQGEEKIADRIQQVTILFSSIDGFSQLSEEREVSEAAALLNELVTGFDDAAEKYDLEKLNALGEHYVAACGLTKQRLDQTKRTLDFALAITHLLQSFNNKHATNLKLRIGIHTGAVKAAIVGNRQFAYNLWGETVNLANCLHQQAKPGSILVTQTAYESVRDLYAFEQDDAIAIKTLGTEAIATWVLVPTSARPQSFTPAAAESSPSAQTDPVSQSGT